MVSPTLTIQNTSYEDKYIANAYWTTKSIVPYDGSKGDLKMKHGIEMNRLMNSLKLNNNLGLGFTFRKGGKTIEYDFKIKIDKVIVTRKPGTTEGNIQSNISVDTLTVFR